MRIARSGRDRGDRTGRRPLSYANVVSTLALFLVLAGGSAFAASHYIITKKN